MRREQGLVLIFVLLTIVALGSMVAFLRLAAWREVRLSRGHRQGLALRLSLPALAAYCREEALRAEDQEEGGLVEGEGFVFVSCDLEDYEILARFSAEDRRLNLNRAQAEELRALFLELGLPASRVEVMVDSLLDWRDADRDHRAQGAERDYYQEEGLPYLPRDGPLESLDEVVLIRGFDPYLFWVDPALYQWVTIYGRRRPEEGGEKDRAPDLKAPGLYREELRIKTASRTYFYLEIFEKTPSTTRVLYRRLLGTAPEIEVPAETTGAEDL